MTKKTKPLGAVHRTARGFELIKFTDRYAADCTLQQSSLAYYEQPGSSAVWLGIGEHRMHLDREQVRQLTVTLNRWWRTGSFEEEKDGID